MKRSSRLAVTILVLAWRGAPFAAPVQDNYEIQVYGAETVEKGHTMVELHSNFTARGNTTSTDGTIPTNHQLHETLEITHGFTNWFETGFYLFFCPERVWMGLCRRSHPPARKSAAQLALAGGREHFAGVWISASTVFRGYLDI